MATKPILWLLTGLTALTISQGALWLAGRALLTGTDVGANLAIVVVAGAVWFALLLVLARGLRRAARARREIAHTNLSGGESR